MILGILTFNACSTVPIETTLNAEVIVTPSGNSSLWIPSPGLSFQIQFTAELDLSVDADVYELDAFDTNDAVIQQLHQSGKHVICYLNAGAVEDWRPDADQYQRILVGNAYQGWPGENWLDIRSLKDLAPILEARLDLCRSKGFDGVEFDNVDGYQNDTGFDLTASDQLTFNRWLADAAHQRGLAVGLKNDPEQITDLEPWFDFLILESCFDQGWCNESEPFVKAGKPVFVIEYSAIDKYCHTAKDKSLTLLQKNLQLDAWRKTCQ
ncbi:MAG: endo alpha-1,4 polygalactosaminidase [Anaerolinea sp.]|nr:endo alpha-1,4 polygalactosaminidase [Anaerolinea sp.]